MSIVSVQATTPSTKASHRRPEVRRRVAAGAKEPWFALNRTDYQAILNMALADMTSSLQLTSDERSAVMSVDGNSTGSELLRLLRTEDEFVSSGQYGFFQTGSSYPTTHSNQPENVKSLSVTILRQPNLLNRSVAMATQQKDPIEDGLSSSSANLDKADGYKIVSNNVRSDFGGSPSKTLATAVTAASPRSGSGVEDEKRFLSNGGSHIAFSVGGNEDVTPKIEKIDKETEVESDKTSPLLNNQRGIDGTFEESPSSADNEATDLVPVKDEPKSPLSTEGASIAASQSEIDSSSSGTIPSDEHHKSSKKLRRVSGQLSSIEEDQGQVAETADDDVSGTNGSVAGWVTVDKNVVASIVDQHLNGVTPPNNNNNNNNPCSDAGRTAPFPFPVCPPPFRLTQPQPAPSHSVSRLLASLLHDSDDAQVSSASSWSPRSSETKQPATNGGASGTTAALPCRDSNNSGGGGASTTRPSLPTSLKTATSGTDEPIEAKRLRKSESALEKSIWQLPQPRVHVRSTWPVPATCRRRAATSGSLGSDVVSSTRSRRHSHGVQRLPPQTLFGSLTAAVAVGNPIRSSNTSRTTSGSQVWTAIDKDLLLGVIDQLLNEDDDESGDIEEAAVDLTVVRPPKSPLADTMCTSASGLQSSRDLIALLSSVSFGRRPHQPIGCPTFRRPDVTDLYQTGNDIMEYEDVVNSNGRRNPTAVKLKWKSNIMQRMRREQVRVTSSPVSVVASSGGAWR